MFLQTEDLTRSAALAVEIDREEARDAAMNRRRTAFALTMHGRGDVLPEVPYARSRASILHTAETNIVEREAFWASDEGVCLAELLEMVRRSTDETYPLVMDALAARSRDYRGERERIEALMAMVREIEAAALSRSEA